MTGLHAVLTPGAPGEKGKSLRGITVEAWAVRDRVQARRVGELNLRLDSSLGELQPPSTGKTRHCQDGWVRCQASAQRLPQIGCTDRCKFRPSYSTFDGQRQTGNSNFGVSRLCTSRPKQSLYRDRSSAIATRVASIQRGSLQLEYTRQTQV